jgi:LPXTG-motif cell wall-anchored protein
MTTASDSPDSLDNDRLIAFRKPSAKSVSILGTSGLILGLGLTGSGAASANGDPGCTPQNTVVAVPKTVGGYLDTNWNNINALLNDVSNTVDRICLDGDFEVDENLVVEGDGRTVHFYGVDGASLSMVGSEGALIAMPFEDVLDDGGVTVRIENLTISSDGNLPAVFAYNVEAKNSTFIDNGASAIWAFNSLEIENSSFLNNSNDGFSIPNPNPNPEPDEPTTIDFPGSGGAVWSFGAVTISNSTFVGNTAFLGGAVYSMEFEGPLNITNSTFIGNKVEGVGAEGGAIYAYRGEILFSTFVNNEAPGPEEDAEVPGNAIYKFGDGELDLGANIFAGSSAFPQLGIGQAELPFTDLGGNVFSTARLTEFDNFSTGAYGVTDGIHSSSVFGASLVALFGTNTPAVATHQPNTSGTQAIGLVETSPARNIVPAGEPFDSVLLDQRGASRTGQVADAGAFEGFVVPATNPASTTALAKTGSDAPWWLTVSSVALLALGGLLSALSAKRRRRTL